MPIGLVSFASPSYQNYESAVAAIDYNISDTDSLRGRFILNRTGFIDTNGFPSVFYNTVPYQLLSGDVLGIPHLQPHGR